MTTQTWKHTVTDLRTKERYEFVGGPEAKEKASDLFDKLFDTGVEWESDPVIICPTCKRPL